MRTWRVVVWFPAVSLMVALGGCGGPSAPTGTGATASPTASPVAARPGKGERQGRAAATPEAVDIAGTVVEILRPVRAERPVTVRLEADGGRHDVRLAPAAFLDQLGLELAVGDAVQVSGARRQQRDREVVVARRLSRGESSFELRSTDGQPLWPRPANGRGAGGDAGEDG